MEIDNTFFKLLPGENQESVKSSCKSSLTTAQFAFAIWVG